MTGVSKYASEYTSLRSQLIIVSNQNSAGMAEAA